MNLAALGAGFHDYQKANLLLQAGDGLSSLGKPLEAEEAFDRVGEIARFSPALQAVIRVQLLQTLAGKYAGLDRWSKALDASHSAAGRVPTQRRRACGHQPAGRRPQLGRRPCVERPAGQAGRALARRRGAHHGPGRQAADQIEPERLALEKALLAEDQAQNSFYTQQRPRALAPARAWRFRGSV